MLSPACGIRDEQKKRGITPTNHARDNVMRIRAMEKLMRERKEAAVQAAVAAKAKPKTYQAVTPRVFSERPSSAPPPPKPPMEPRNFACPKPSGPAGRIFTAWEPPPLMREGAPAVYGTGARREKLKPTVPRREPPPPKPAPVDFVKRNADLSCLTPRKAPGSPASPPGTSEKSKYHGRVPPYLLDRKMELASKAAAKEAAAAPRDCPEGTHILPEEERQRVLAVVREGQAKCHAELDKMPFVVDTFGLKEKQNSLSKQLAQLDAAEQAFSRSKVVVQDDAPVTPPTSPARALLALPAGAPGTPCQVSQSESHTGPIPGSVRGAACSSVPATTASDETATNHLSHSCTALRCSKSKAPLRVQIVCESRARRASPFATDTAKRA